MSFQLWTIKHRRCLQDICVSTAAPTKRSWKQPLPDRYLGETAKLIEKAARQPLGRLQFGEDLLGFLAWEDKFCEAALWLFPDRVELWLRLEEEGGAVLHRIKPPGLTKALWLPARLLLLPKRLLRQPLEAFMNEEERLFLLVGQQDFVLMRILEQGGEQ